MATKSVTDSVFPNDNWILDVLNTANWDWGCRIPCKNKFHNQRAKDLLFLILFSLTYTGPMTYLRRNHGPSYLKTRPLSTHLQTARGLLHQFKGPYPLSLPERRRPELWESQLTLYLDIPNRQVLTYRASPLFAFQFTPEVLHRTRCHKRSQNRKPRNGYHDGSF